MAITAKIDADYSAFFTANDKAAASLLAIDKAADKINSQLDDLMAGYDTGAAVGETKALDSALTAVSATAASDTAPALKEVAAASEAAGEASVKTSASFGDVGKSLNSVGINLGTLPAKFDKFAEAMGQSVGSLGKMATGLLVVDAAMAGWQIGKKIDELTGWSDAIARNTAAWMGWGDVTAETAAASADTLARASAVAGRQITTMAEAIRVLGDESVRMKAELALGEEAAKTFGDNVAKLFGFDDINRAEEYRQALGGVQNVTKLTTDAKKELNTSIKTALETYKAMGMQAPAELVKIELATRELIKVNASFSAANSGMWAEYAAGAEDGSARMAAIAEAAKLTWEDIWTEMGGHSRAELESIAVAAEETFAVASQHSERFTPAQIANFEKVAVAARAAVENWGQVTLEAYDAVAAASDATANTQIANAQRASAATVTSWHEAMSAVAAGQGTMGGTVGGNVDHSAAAKASIQKAYDEGRYYGPVVNVSETNPRGTGPDWAALGYRARGGPVTAGQPYMVGERGPELFVPRESGTVHANGAGLTVNNTIMVTGGTETLARQVADEIMRTIRAGTQLGTA